MTNYTFDSFNTIGFDRIFESLNQTLQSQTNYPPYNIIKTSENEYVLELAVAGFTTDDLDVSVKDHTIHVTGNPQKEERTYLYKGIASRAFTRTFALANNIEVVDADIRSGMLYINLKSITPEDKKGRKIPIGSVPKPLNELLSE